MNIAVILSGGVGTRMGTGIPKQYVVVGGKPVIMYCIEQFMGSGLVDALIVCLDGRWKPFVDGHVSRLGLRCPVYYSEAGETRQHTIFEALRCARRNGYGDGDVVIIHDAARPLVDRETIASCLSGCEGHDGAIASVGVKDTVYVAADDGCVADVPRRCVLRAGQTPEAFRLGKYLAAHEGMGHDEISAVTGGAEFAFRRGMKVFLSEGKETNFKLTTPGDLRRFERMMEEEGHGE